MRIYGGDGPVSTVTTARIQWILFGLSSFCVGCSGSYWLERLQHEVRPVSPKSVFQSLSPNDKYEFCAARLEEIAIIR